MKALKGLLALACALALATPAFAQNFQARDGNGNLITVCSKVVAAGVNASCQALVDASGNQLGVPSNPVPTTGAASVVTATLTRPANTTAYTANTALSTSTVTGTYLTFANVCRSAGAVVLIPAINVTDYANQTTKLTGVLFLFNVSPGTSPADNATFNLVSTDVPNKVATIPFTVSTVLNQNSGASGIAEASVTGVNYEAICGASPNLYGLIEVTNPYTPVSAEQFTITLKTVAAN